MLPGKVSYTGPGGDPYRPGRKIAVLASIEDVSLPRSFLGKTKAKDLLRVDFKDEPGGEDACAWLVPSLPWWEEAIAALREGKEPPTPPWKNQA